jgi:hypothetical protein
METTEISQRAGPQHRRGRLARRRLEPRNLPDTEQLFVFLYIEFYLPMQQSVQPKKKKKKKKKNKSTVAFTNLMPT